MKVFKTIMKIFVALAAIAGAVYVAATYGDQIVAWAKKILSKLPCKCCCSDEPVAEECDIVEEPAAEEAAPVVEEAAPTAEEAVEEAPAAEEAAEEAPVAEEADFEA